MMGLILERRKIHFENTKSNQITEVPAGQKGWIRAGQRKLVNQEGRSSISFQHKQYTGSQTVHKDAGFRAQPIDHQLFIFTFPPNLKEKSHKNMLCPNAYSIKSVPYPFLYYVR
jgi:hypothetical protein